LKAKLKAILNGFLAAVTSPEAVRAERSLAALVIVRVMLAAGASAGLVALIGKLVHG
jgi:hypothetical protein